LSRAITTSSVTSVRVMGRVTLAAASRASGASDFFMVSPVVRDNNN
jgi:uncharacterized protein YqeY